MSPMGRTIAIVDDDDAVCESTRFLLEIHDFEVLTYRGGRSLLGNVARRYGVKLFGRIRLIGFSLAGSPVFCVGSAFVAQPQAIA
jgi:FixJ family two-component response regulator